MRFKNNSSKRSKSLPHLYFTMLLLLFPLFVNAKNLTTENLNSNGVTDLKPEKLNFLKSLFNLRPKRQCCASCSVVPGGMFNCPSGCDGCPLPPSVILQPPIPQAPCIQQCQPLCLPQCVRRFLLIPLDNFAGEGFITDQLSGVLGGNLGGIGLPGGCGGGGGCISTLFSGPNQIVIPPPISPFGPITCPQPCLPDCRKECIQNFVINIRPSVCNGGSCARPFPEPNPFLPLVPAPRPIVPIPQVTIPPPPPPEILLPPPPLPPPRVIIPPPPRPVVLPPPPQVVLPPPDVVPLPLPPSIIVVGGQKITCPMPCRPDCSSNCLQKILLPGPSTPFPYGPIGPIGPVPNGICVPGCRPDCSSSCLSKCIGCGINNIGGPGCPDWCGGGVTLPSGTTILPNGLPCIGPCQPDCSLRCLQAYLLTVQPVTICLPACQPLCTPSCLNQCSNCQNSGLCPTMCNQINPTGPVYNPSSVFDYGPDLFIPSLGPAISAGPTMFFDGCAPGCRPQCAPGCISQCNTCLRNGGPCPSFCGIPSVPIAAPIQQATFAPQYLPPYLACPQVCQPECSQSCTCQNCANAPCPAFCNTIDQPIAMPIQPPLAPQFPLPPVLPTPCVPGCRPACAPICVNQCQGCSSLDGSCPEFCTQQRSYFAAAPDKVFQFPQTSFNSIGLNPGCSYPGCAPSCQSNCVSACAQCKYPSPGCPGFCGPLVQGPIVPPLPVPLENFSPQLQCIPACQPHCTTTCVQQCDTCATGGPCPSICTGSLYPTLVPQHIPVQAPHVLPSPVLSPPTYLCPSSCQPICSPKCIATACKSCSQIPTEACPCAQILPPRPPQPLPTPVPLLECPGPCAPACAPSCIKQQCSACASTNIPCPNICQQTLPSQLPLPAPPPIIHPTTSYLTPGCPPSCQPICLPACVQALPPPPPPPVPTPTQSSCAPTCQPASIPQCIANPCETPLSPSPLPPPPSPPAILPPLSPASPPPLSAKILPPVPLFLTAPPLPPSPGCIPQCQPSCEPNCIQSYLVTIQSICPPTCKPSCAAPCIEQHAPFTAPCVNALTPQCQCAPGYAQCGPGICCLRYKNMLKRFSQLGSHINKKENKNEKSVLNLKTGVSTKQPNVKTPMEIVLRWPKILNKRAKPSVKEIINSRNSTKSDENTLSNSGSD